MEEITQLCTYLSRPYALDALQLLVNYRDLAASELSSRLRLHIRTMQEFLEGLTSLGVLTKEEVYEKKRPYYRYQLAVEKIGFSFDLNALKQETQMDQEHKIRESQAGKAKFTVARSDSYISNVVIYKGEGRDRDEQKINLTMPQGKFLFHLPFPNAQFMGISEIMEKAGLTEEVLPEINDLVAVLIENGVIEEDQIR
jgi:predicted transcriptional regulator